MGRIHTKKQLNFILRQVGAGGLSGVTVPADTNRQALEQIAGVPAGLSARFVTELRRQELIEFSRTTGTITLQLTVKGIHRVQQSEIQALHIPVPATWDGHWHMVLFDIPAHHKHQRYRFTSQLRRLGFVMVRDSTWYHSYPCREVLDTLIRFCGLSNYVTTGEVVRLDASTTRTLLRHFPRLTAREE